jgi:hypothetical protein
VGTSHTLSVTVFHIPDAGGKPGVVFHTCSSTTGDSKNLSQKKSKKTNRRDAGKTEYVTYRYGKKLAASN